jgi:hypothetical protein
VVVVLLFSVIWVMLKMVLKCVAYSCCLQLLGLWSFALLMCTDID